MKNKTDIKSIDAQFGKVPPQAIEVEGAVLGALILEGDAYARISDIISPESFYDDKNRKICEVVKEIFDEQKPIDLVQVTQRLKDKGILDEVGGLQYIMEIARHVASASNIEHHARIIAQKHLQRKLITLSVNVQNKAYDDSEDVASTIEFLYSELHRLDSVGNKNIVSPKQAIDDIYNAIKKNYELQGRFNGIATGLRELDEFMGGLQMSDLTIIAAEPSQGKTSLLLTLFRNMAEDNVPVGLVSYEMSIIQLYVRILAQMIDVPQKKILRQKLEDYEIAYIDSVKERFSNLPIKVEESFSGTLSDLLSTIRHLNKKFEIKVFGIDYVQLINLDANSKTNREGELAMIARSLKNLAKELDISIIILSQLKRDDRNDHKPTLSRLRGSGQLEEAADNVIFIYRPEEYGIDFINDVIPSQGRAVIDIAKGRNIGVAEFVCKFDKVSGKFYDNSAYNDFLDPNAWINGD